MDDIPSGAMRVISNGGDTVIIPTKLVKRIKSEEITTSEAIEMVKGKSEQATAGKIEATDSPANQVDTVQVGDVTYHRPDGATPTWGRQINGKAEFADGTPLYQGITYDLHHNGEMVKSRVNSHFCKLLTLAFKRQIALDGVPAKSIAGKWTLKPYVKRAAEAETSGKIG